jgi:hypothetical protein
MPIGRQHILPNPLTIFFFSSFFLSFVFLSFFSLPKKRRRREEKRREKKKEEKRRKKKLQPHPIVDRKNEFLQETIFLGG